MFDIHFLYAFFLVLLYKCFCIKIHQIVYIHHERTTQNWNCVSVEYHLSTRFRSEISISYIIQIIYLLLMPLPPIGKLKCEFMELVRLFRHRRIYTLMRILPEA